VAIADRSSTWKPKHRADVDTPVDEAEAAWQQAIARTPDRDELFTTMSGDEVPRMSTPASADIDYARDLGYPGQAPFTRGVYPSMYRGKPWTQRQFAGFGTAAETNERFHYLLEHGQHGLSVAFDMPSLMGYDSDDDMSLGEVGREGVAVDTVLDMERLFEGVPMGDVSTSMTINGPAPIFLAFYAVAAERQGVEWSKLSGTIQTDILKEYIAQKEWLFPPDPSMRLVTDMVEFCTKDMPRWHPISISGYHIREAGSNAAQELAFTLSNGFAYVEHAIERGLDVDSFAPRLSFFFNAHIDFFEEVAKLRAARRIWATVMAEKYGAKDPRSLLCRFHCQTAGVSLTWQQPLVNIARTAVEAMAAVMGGCQSLHTNSYDEAIALPTEEAVQIALRTQQVIAEETGIASTIDPLGGSYFVEEMTNRIEAQAYEYFARIEELGGTVEAVKQNFQMREIAEASFAWQQEVEAGERRIVGVNAYQVQDEPEVAIHTIDPKGEVEQAQRVRDARAGRDEDAAQRALAALTEAARGDANLMYPLVECARATCTEGEIVRALRTVFGSWTETPVF
jgi:methylmalonyl-CoA mutase N-terminal domain/subunit